MTRNQDTLSPDDPRECVSHAALMGDIILSTRTSSVEDLYSSFNAVIDEVNRGLLQCLVSPLTITLGDEFQGLCPTLSHGLEVVRLLRHRLLARAVECRFSLGAVRLKTPINQERAWNMMGPGLAGTRAKLNEKLDRSRYRFSFPGQPMIENLVESLASAISEIELNWTPRQREIILASLAGDATPLAVAREFGIGTHTVYKVRNAGNFELYQNYWGVLADTVAGLDTRYGLA